MSVFKNLPSPPVVAKKPVSDTRHGITRTDDYAWLRADNWQQMFKDTSILDPEIRSTLEAENAYMEAAMADIGDASKYTSHWPGNAGYGAGGANARPRSATIVITKTDGGVIGS